MAKGTNRTITCTEKDGIVRIKIGKSLALILATPTKEFENFTLIFKHKDAEETVLTLLINPKQLEAK